MGWHAIGGQSWSRFLNLTDEYPDQTSAAISLVISIIGNYRPKTSAFINLRNAKIDKLSGKRKLLYVIYIIFIC